MSEKAKVINIKDKQKPKGTNQTLEVKDGKMGGKGSMGGSK